MDQLKSNISTSLLSILLFVFFSCGGVSDFQQGPLLDPFVYLRDYVSGLKIFRDRNMNVRSHAQIQRSCISVSELEGDCEDSILFAGSPEPVIEKFHYRFSYDENLLQHLSLKGEKLNLQGRMYGSGLYLEGSLSVPGTDKMRTVETRWDRYPGEKHMSVQKDMYYFGILFTGSAETVWYK